MAPMQNIIVVLALVSQTLMFTNGSSSPSLNVFGKCQVGRESCRDCYISLAQSLFQNDDNVFNLSQTFFPPHTNTPEFVVVRYHFEFRNESSHKDEVEVWFWGASASYFIYPLATFQFLSLFFGQTEAYWTGEVDVTLNATECLGAKREHLIMLTQRLRIYVEQYDIRPSIDDTYQAEAMNSDAFKDLYSQNANQLINIVICIQTLGVLMIFVCTVVVIACGIKSAECKRFLVKEIKYKSAVNKQATLFSLSVNGLIFLLYAIAMDGAAVHYRNYSLLSDLKKVHHSDEIGQPFDVLYKLPLVALVFDIFALVMYIALLTCTVFYYFYKLDSDHQTYSVPSVTPSLLGPLFCLISHLPYIAIAYINDAYHAGSIFVYYMVVFFVCFAAIHITTRSYFEFWILKESNIRSKYIPKRITCDFKRLIFPLIIIVIVLLFFLLCTVAMVICYFVIIPLNASISSAPRQLIGFYQTVIIFLGIFIAYKTFLHKKTGLKSAVVNRKSSEEWKELPDEEKKRKFYDMVISVVEYKYKQTQQSSESGGTGNDSRSPEEGSGPGDTQHSLPTETAGKGSGPGDTQHSLPTGTTEEDTTEEGTGPGDTQHSLPIGTAGKGSGPGGTQHSLPTGTAGQGSGPGDTQHFQLTGSSATGTASRSLEGGSKQEGDDDIEMKDTKSIVTVLTNPRIE